MIKTIKRTVSCTSLSPPRVRFALDSKTCLSASQGESTVSMQGDSYEASTVGDTLSSASSSSEDESMSIPLDNPPGSDFTGVVSESFRALAMSAWLVGETISAIGSEVFYCGCDSPLNSGSQRRVTANGEKGRKNDNRFGDDSSFASYPPSRPKRRKKRSFGFFGLGNRGRKNQDSGYPSTVTTKAVPTSLPPPPLKKSVPPKAPATPPKASPTATTTHLKHNMHSTKTSDHSPARAKKLLTACFVKKPGQLLGDGSNSLMSRYRHEHEDLHLTPMSSVFTIRMSRVPTAEFEDLY